MIFDIRDVSIKGMYSDDPMAWLFVVGSYAPGWRKIEDTLSKRYGFQ